VGDDKACRKHGLLKVVGTIDGKCAKCSSVAVTKQTTRLTPAIQSQIIDEAKASGISWRRTSKGVAIRPCSFHKHFVLAPYPAYDKPPDWLAVPCAVCIEEDRLKKAECDFRIAYREIAKAGFTVEPYRNWRAHVLIRNRGGAVIGKFNLPQKVLVTSKRKPAAQKFYISKEYRHYAT
jgi:hypothetical protein